MASAKKTLNGKNQGDNFNKRKDFEKEKIKKMISIKEKTLKGKK